LRSIECAQCDAARVYWVRCALVHTAGASNALIQTGVGAWKLTVGYSSDHYAIVQEDVARFRLEMPDFLAELMLATDRFLNDRRIQLENASTKLRSRIGHIAILASADDNAIYFLNSQDYWMKRTPKGGTRNRHRK
jgi:hypothetical protein